MCGIVGFLSRDNNSRDWREPLEQMTASLHYRGPDDAGMWFDAEAGVAFGHRRLSIIDLSAEGQQPRHSSSGRFWLSFNGEIYNFRELRKELERAGHSFRGHSDTEVMLAAFEQWGLEAAVKRFVGMFAFALWDGQKRELHLVRDRMGEKPLYYGWVGKTFLFGSELKALQAHSEWRGEIDRDALALLVRYNYIPAPYSIYKDIYKLLPGTILTLKISGAGEAFLEGPVAYWSARAAAEAGAANHFSGSAAEAADELEALLRQAVAQQMVADVPLGAFLSGGIDSSIVVTLMQSQSPRAVKTFTIGFDEQGYDEARYAREVARHLGTDHTELYVTADDAMQVIPRLAGMYDEPFADASQIPTHLVAKLARGRVMVALSGDGGDELFCGYTRYQIGRELWDKISLVPEGIRRGVARAIKGVPIGAWNNLLGWASPLLDRYRPDGFVGDRLHKAAEVLSVQSPEMMYHRFISHCKDPHSFVPNSRQLPTAYTDGARAGASSDLSRWMMLTDMLAYLPDDILVKLDRASMAVSLESRVPLLDHRLVEFAWRLPMEMKFRDGRGKWLLRQVLHRYMPEGLVERPKMGFAVPVGNWLRGPLREWAESLLEGACVEGSYFDAAQVRRIWAEHLSGRFNWQGDLWNVLMFQQWLEHQ
jgi:asparagine synthase (glutamine-hydrolysing)